MQARPHMPQWVPLVWRLTQTPPQRVPPVGHAQAPAVQVAPPVHDTPQAPQWALSVAVVTQTPPQAVWPGPQVDAHEPALQVWSAPQALPQVPQWALLVWRLTQTPPQRVEPAGQAHMPMAHWVPPAQVRPQAPQLPLSL